MITKAQVKDIRALATVKGRQEQGAFAIEGDKLAREWLAANAPVNNIVGLESWIAAHGDLIKNHPEATIIAVSASELERISTQQTPHSAVIVAPIPAPPDELPVAEWCLVLDTIQDPGNLGTIIRIADWFGVSHVVCSHGCADFYNPKVVASAMGGHLRVRLHTAVLPEFLAACKIPILAAVLDGVPMESCERPARAALIIGNESRGISQEVLRFATRKVTIPRRGGAESLNAAVSAGILLAVLGPA